MIGEDTLFGFWGYTSVPHDQFADGSLHVPRIWSAKPGVSR